MSRFIKVAVGQPVVSKTEDEGYRVLHFLYYLAINKRDWTGYKELARWKIDRFWADNFYVLQGPTICGSYSFHPTELDDFVKALCCTDDVEYYWLDTDCFYNGEDVARILKERNPVWMIPAEEFEVYDEAIWNDLTTYRKQSAYSTSVGSIRYLSLKEDVEDQVYRQLKSAYEKGTLDKQPNHLLEWFYNRDWEGDVCEKVEKDLNELLSLICDSPKESSS